MVNRMRDLFLVILTCRATWENLMPPARSESTTISLCGKVQNSDSYFIKYFALIFEIQNVFVRFLVLYIQWGNNFAHAMTSVWMIIICKRLTQILQGLDFKTITLIKWFSCYLFAVAHVLWHVTLSFPRANFVGHMSTTWLSQCIRDSALVWTETWCLSKSLWLTW